MLLPSYHMAELKNKDIGALREGVLGSAYHYESLQALATIRDLSLRKQTSQMLDQIKNALDQRLAEDFARESAAFKHID